MKHPILLLTCAALASLAPLPVLAAGAPAKTTAKPAQIDPNALGLLKRMSDTLAGARAFTFQSDAILQVPAVTGQFITVFSEGHVALQRPDKLAGHLGGEAPRFDFYYDGKTVSAFAPMTNVYSQTPAPPTIDAMLAGLERETGIRFPTAPLLFSDPYAILTRGLETGIVLGPTLVKGTLCTHLAFRSPGVNWEIWIAHRDALPYRLAVTFADRPGFPRTIIEFSHWNLHPWLWPSQFVFRKPAGAQEIPFLSVVHSAKR